MRSIILIIFVMLRGWALAAETYSRFQENGKVGLKNQAGQIIIPAVYDALGWSNGNFSVVGKVIGYQLRESWGILSLSNERITKTEYASLTPGDGTILVASKRSASFQLTTGCIGTDGKVVIPFVYTGVASVHSLRVVAFVREGNLFKHGLIDLENKILIPFQYRNIYPIGSLRYAVENFEGKTALFSEGGKQISGFSIDSISALHNNLAIIYESGNQGIINREGQLLVEPRYRNIQITSSGVSVILPDAWQVLNAANIPSDTILADSITYLGESRYKLKIAGIAKLTYPDFKPLTGQHFSNIGAFQTGLAIVQSGKYFGVIRRNGKIVLPVTYRGIVFSGHHILTHERNVDQMGWALRDSLGQRLHSRNYDLILPRHYEIFPALKNGYWGALDHYGVEIIACVYDSILEVGQNQVAVKFKGQYGIISLREEWLAYPQPYKVKLLNGDRYFKQIGNTLFLCSFNGTVLYFTNNLIEVKTDHLLEHVSSGGTWTIDFDGRIVSRQLAPVEPTEKIFPSTEGLRGIRKNGKFGFIDDEGRLRIANRYDDIKAFSEGLAAVKIRNKWGFINRDEKIIIQPAYEDVSPFEKGYSFVKQGGSYGLITPDGKLMLPVRYHAIEVLGNGRFLLTVNGLKGLADEFGNVVLHPKYESLTDLNNGYVIVQQEGKFGLTTLQGVSTIPTIYDHLTFNQERKLYLALKKSSWSFLTIP